jgi:hypothetical protein
MTLAGSLARSVLMLLTVQGYEGAGGAHISDDARKIIRNAHAQIIPRCVHCGDEATRVAHVRDYDGPDVWERARAHMPRDCNVARAAEAEHGHDAQSSVRDMLNFELRVLENHASGCSKYEELGQTHPPRDRGTDCEAVEGHDVERRIRLSGRVPYNHFAFLVRAYVSGDVGTRNRSKPTSVSIPECI